jgi:hypothetical protein
MADIFLSYARADLTRVRPLAEALQQRGWTVFWDRHLEPGSTWPAVLERELARSCCVVVVWSEASVESDWVRREAEIGRQRNVLVPVRLTPVTPPPDFRDFHVAELTGWDESTEAAEFQDVAAAIRRLCGARGDVTIEPKLLLIVVGDPEVYRGVGPILNVTCRFSNQSSRAANIRRLDLATRGPGGLEYHLRWHLFFDTHGMQQRKVDATARIELPAGTNRDLGVQFQGPSFGGGEVTWPAGDYSSDLTGWTEDRSSQDKPNLVTLFRSTLTARDAAWVRHWQTIDRREWNNPQITDRAIGVPVPIHDVKPGR